LSPGVAECFPVDRSPLAPPPSEVAGEAANAWAMRALNASGVCAAVVVAAAAAAAVAAIVAGSEEGASEEGWFIPWKGCLLSCMLLAVDVGPSSNASNGGVTFTLLLALALALLALLLQLLLPLLIISAQGSP